MHRQIGTMLDTFREAYADCHIFADSDEKIVEIHLEFGMNRQIGTRF